MSTHTVKFELGALCEPPSKQLAGLLTDEQAKRFDGDAFAITRLHIDGYIGDRASDAARRKLIRRIKDAIEHRTS